jgi:hypothetical protein
MERLSAANHVRGRVRPYQVRNADNENVLTWPKEHPSLSLPGHWNRQAPWHHNDVLYSWGAIASRALTQTGTNYRINGMYMEFQNVANAGNVVTPPTFDRSGGREYYDALSSSPNTDYLRVPLIATSLDNSDPSLFDDVNRMTFYAMSQGVVGANGKPFSDVYNSKVFGGALVCIVDLADRTQDIVFSRFYYPTSLQQVKLSTSQIGQEWQLSLV